MPPSHAVASFWLGHCLGLALFGLGLSIFTLPATALESTGYFRAGIGSDTEGHEQACFQLPGAEIKYRLGNECELYSEFGANHELHEFGNGAALRAIGMLSLENRYGVTPTFQGDRGDTRLPQLYTEIAQLPALNGGSLWIGRRYYRRNDVHIADFYYWSPSGLGAGIEEFGLGYADLTLSYGFFREDDLDQPHKASRHDLQLAGIPSNRNGQLRLGFSYIDKPSRLPTAHSGWSVTVQHQQQEVLGGDNRLALQYGRGPGIGLGQTGPLDAPHQRERWRLVEALSWQFGSRFNGQLMVAYQQDRSLDGDQHWYSLGARPVYALTEHWKVALELGHDRVKPDNEDTRTLTKATLALLLAAGRQFDSRPELRLFVTHARWNTAAQDAAQVGDTLSRSGVYGSRRHGTTLGLQVEVSW